MNEKILNFSKKYVDDIVGFMDISPTVEASFTEDVYQISIEGNDLNFLIGYRGSSLNGLQHMLSLAAFREFGDWYRFFVDINGYRLARKEKLEDMARSLIDRVRFFSKEVSFPPMQAFERKQVHEFVSQYDDVESYSVGQGYDRHIVLKPV